MNKKLLIIKIGGSVITDKNSPIPIAVEEIIQQISKEVGDIYKTNKYKIILVHGAGSFGHPLVKKSGIYKGMRSLDHKLSYSQVVQNMLQLNTLIINNLINNQAPAVSITPHSFIKNNNQDLLFNTSLIKDYLEQTIIPVLYGDMILDDNQNCSVLSGDVIVSYLAKNFNPEKVIFLTDVEGIFDSDPKVNKNAKLISEINNDNLNNVLSSITTNNPNDVTGEMKGKIESIKEHLKKTNVFIINGSKPRNLLKVLDEQNIGTKLLFD